MDRAAVLDHLENTPGKHLIIVDYLPIHNEDSEWVYNEANIDASPVVWARDMGEKDNQELLRYFHDREAWTIVVSDTHHRPCYVILQAHQQIKLMMR